MKTRFALTVLALLAAAPAGAETLITPAESALPPAPAGLVMRGVTRGPTVKLVSPTAIKSPFDFQVKFEAHGGAQVEPNSVKVTYLKSPVVDVTDRVKPYVTAQGIIMPKAEIPAGQHAIKVELKDSEGRAGSAILDLAVEK